MKQISGIMRGILVAACLAAVPALAAVQESQAGNTATAAQEAPAGNSATLIRLAVPLTSPLFADVPVASVDEETITLRDLVGVLVASHEDRMGKEKERGAHIDYLEPLNRLINVKLVMKDAHTIGLDELPEVANTLENFTQAALAELLRQRVTKDIAAGDEEVEPVYKETVKEWKMRSLLFKDEEQAKKAEKELKAGGDFTQIATAALNEGTAKGKPDSEYVKAATLSPEVAGVVAKMEAGSVSPVIKVGAGARIGYSVVLLEEVRYPDDPAVREQARIQVVVKKKNDAMLQYRAGLYEKYAKVDERLVKKLDYDSAPPDLKKLSEDDRALVTIEGEEPILVKDLTEAIRKKYFHGVAIAMEEKKINKETSSILDGMIDKRLYRKEAKLLGIDKSKEFAAAVREFRETLLFGLYMQKVIAPDIRVNDEDRKRYYREHLADYTYPEMVKVSGLAFDTVRDARAALTKLRKGAEFSWVQANAEGRTDPKAVNVMQLRDSILIVRTLPKGMQMALKGVKAGDYRLATGSDKRHYVLFVQAHVPEQQRPVDEVSEEIFGTVRNIKMMQQLEETCAKVREESDVRIYLSSSGAKAKAAR